MGVATGDMGVAKDGSHKQTFARGIALRARATLFGEGARGSLSQASKAQTSIMGGFDQMNKGGPQKCRLPEVLTRAGGWGL